MRKFAKRTAIFGGLRMKAAFIDRYGNNDLVKVADIAVPALGPGDLLIKVRADGDQLGEIAKLVETGVVKPLVDKVFSLEQVREALAYSDSGRVTGKVVIRVA